MKAGRIVQIVSISWASKIVRQDSLFIRSAIIAYLTTPATIIRISMAWS